MQTVKKILYIDGDKKHRKRAKSAFSKKQYHCTLCTSGKEGLKLIENENPEIVIVDNSLPDMSAEEFYTTLLSQSDIHKIINLPFIALTTNGKVSRSRLYSLGFNGCLAKPFKSNRLKEIVDDVLVSHRLKVEEHQFWETIRDAKDFLERVVESSVDAIVTTDTKGTITYCNNAAEEITGYCFEELIGMRVAELLTNGSSEMMKIMSILNKRSKMQNYKTEILRKDKTKVAINVSITTMKNSEGRVMGVLGISKVISGKEYRDYDHHESDRLATIIETAVAVNHAINNPLVPIIGNAQFLLHDENIVDENIRKRLKVIIKNAMRIRDITQKLARISNPVTKEYLRGTRMLDIDAST